MRILLLNPNLIKRRNWGHQLYKNEIGRQSDVLYYGEGYPNFDPKLTVKEIIDKKCKYKPDAILTYCWKYSQNFKGLEEINDIPKIHIALDYTEKTHYEKQNESLKRDKYNLIFAFSVKAKNLLIKNKHSENIEFLPFSVDTNIYKKNKNIKKESLVLTAFSDMLHIYPNRKKIKLVLKKIGVKQVTNVLHNRLIHFINKCKITATSNNLYSSLSMRYTETLACGGFLLADRPLDLDICGFKDKKHLIIYENLDDFKDKIQYYLKPKHDKERINIENMGMKFVRNNHSCKTRVAQMLNFINKDLNIK